MIGKTIRNIRKDKNIPIKAICKGIIDEGNYWRLENEHLESSFSTIVKILERLNVSVEDFISLTSLTSITMYKKKEKDLDYYFKNKDQVKLENLKNDIHEELKINESLYLKNLYVLTDLYLSRIKKEKYNSCNVKLVKDYLINCENWGLYEITLLSNTLFVYDTDSSLMLYKRAFEKFSIDEITESKVVPLTLNLLSLNALEDKKNNMEFLLNKLIHMKIDEKDTYYMLIRKWGINIAQYCLNGEYNHLESAEKNLEIMRDLDMTNTFNMYSSWTQAYVKLKTEQLS